MMQTDTNLFYSQLPLHGLGLDELLGKEELFVAMPSDWHIIITDIKNSTQAVLEGRLQAVNFIATGSIVAVLNIANKMDVDVPFFFGGDGATFIVPPLIIAPVMQALFLYKKNSQANFNLEIRTGTITVDKVYNDGYELNISKHSRSSVFSIPVILGNGLNYAERLIKGAGYLGSQDLQQEYDLDMSGMQCRWDRIAPPENREEVVALLVIARSGFRQSFTFRKVMQKIEEIYGPARQRQPISVTRLRRQTTYDSIKTELLAKFGKFRFLRFIQARIERAYAFIYLRTLKGKLYLEAVIEMSDTLAIDGKINTIISGTALQRQNLEECLAQMEYEKEIFYGLHISKASVMSCYVRNMDDGHIHFVDGAEGGYTQASRTLKRKLAGALDAVNS